MKRSSQIAGINFFLFIIVISLFSCSQEPLNSIEGLRDKPISLAEWGILGPFKDTLRSIGQIDSLKRIALKGDYLADSLKHQELNSFKNLRYFVYKEKTTTEVVDLQELFNIDQAAVAYAMCDVTSEREQDVNFFIKVDDVMRLWVNDKQIAHLDFTLGKTVKINLRKGSNRLVVEVKNTINEWFFSLSATKQPKKDVYNAQFYVRPKTALLNIGDSLEFEITNRNYIIPKIASKIEILDIRNRLLSSSNIDIGRHEGVSLKSLPSGAYKYRLFTDRDTFSDYFCYGDFDTLYNRDRFAASYSRNPKVYNELLPYFFRLDTLSDAYKKGPTALLSSKISYCVYKVHQIDQANRGKGGEALYDMGLSLHKFSSSIDHGDEYYMLYIPERFKADRRPIPLIVIVPYVTYSHPFYSGKIVANTERVSYISRYAEKYGMAVIWPSSRIFTDYNHTPIVTKTIVETLKDAEKHFKLDTKHLFLYGDCTGGLFAFQTANRRPDLFSAIAVEGPDLKSIDFREPLQSGLLSNSLFDLAANLHGKSVFFLHSDNDYKAPINLSKRLMDSIKRNGGSVFYDNLGGAAKYKFVKLYSEAENMGKIFEFFNRQKNSKPSPIKKIATYAFYNDTVYGVFIKRKIRAGRATLSYQVKGRRIDVATNNVAAFTMDVNSIGWQYGKSVDIYLNGLKTLSEDYLIGKGGKYLEFQVDKDERASHAEMEVSGPMNKVFLNTFAVVRPEKAGKKEDAIISALDSLWLTEYRNHVIVVRPKEIAAAKMRGLNFIYIVKDIDDVSEPILKKAGVGQTADAIIFKGKTISKLGTSFAFYYKDGRETDNLYLGTNEINISVEMLRSIIKEGWNDLEIWDGEYPILQSSYR